ncbi:MAG: hypothetical protein ACQR33_00040 [Candidatus Saccharibacteria bacterium]
MPEDSKVFSTDEVERIQKFVRVVCDAQMLDLLTDVSTLSRDDLHCVLGELGAAYSTFTEDSHRHAPQLMLAVRLVRRTELISNTFIPPDNILRKCFARYVRQIKAPAPLPTLGGALGKK